MSARLTPRRLMQATLAGLLASGTASCGGGGDTGDLPPPASPPRTADQSPGLDLSPAEQQAVDEAQAKFDEFMNAYITVSTAEIPTTDEAEGLFARVDQHTGGGDLPVDLRKEIVGHWGEGVLSEGTLSWEFVKTVGTDLKREVQGEKVPEVILEYCVDATDWIAVDTATGERVEDSGSRSTWTVIAYWYNDWDGLGHGPEGWRIGEREVQDRPC